MRQTKQTAEGMAKKMESVAANLSKKALLKLIVLHTK